MLKRTLRITVNGVNFTRRTHRTYTHVVVSVPGPTQLDLLRQGLAACGDTHPTSRQWYEDAVANITRAIEEQRPTYATWHTRQELAEQESALRANGGISRRAGYFGTTTIVPVD